MSYDIRLIDKNGETIQLPNSHNFTGGTYAVGGTTEAWLNVTYNYYESFVKVLGEDGIRTIYGKTNKETRPLLLEAITKLKDDVHQDYWEPTEGNARKALINLLNISLLAPDDAIWDGD